MSVATAGEILRLNFKQAAQVAKTNRRLAQETAAEFRQNKLGCAMLRTVKVAHKLSQPNLKTSQSKKAEPADKINMKKENYEFFTLQLSRYK